MNRRRFLHALLGLPVAGGIVTTATVVLNSAPAEARPPPWAGGGGRPPGWSRGRKNGWRKKGGPKWR